MLDAVRRYVEAGREALTEKKAEELARDLVKQGQARRDQAAKVARDLAEWSRKNSERFLKTVRTEVTKQMSRAGVATKGDIESLKRRIRKLESAGKGTTRKRSTAGRSSRRTSSRSSGG